MKFKDVNSVSLIYRFKLALDQEEYLLCKEIKEELLIRKENGQLNNEVIQATQEAYLSYKDLKKNSELEVFTEMLNEIKQR